jgi:hypothetical protein
MSISTASSRPSHLIRASFAAIAVLALGTGTAAAGDTVVFATDFESGIPPEMSAPGAAIESVQGWSGLGDEGRAFDGSFLRHSSPEFREIALTLTDLPEHGAISIEVLVALIDSWDFEYFQVLVDGELVFSEWFDLAISHTSSYEPPAGVLLSERTDLGFTTGGYYNDDRAYDLSVDDRLTNIPHSGDSVTIVWRIDDTITGNWQGGTDESWAIEAITVKIDTGASPVEASSWTSMKSTFRD